MQLHSFPDMIGKYTISLNLEAAERYGMQSK